MRRTSYLSFSLFLSMPERAGDEGQLQRLGLHMHAAFYCFVEGIWSTISVLCPSRRVASTEQLPSEIVPGVS